MTFRANENGFTLIETVVVVVLVAILAGAGYAFFFVLTREKTETAAYLKAQMQSEALFDVLAKHVRNADFIFDKSTTSGSSGYFVDPNGSDLYTDAVYFFRNSEPNKPIAALRVEKPKSPPEPKNFTVYLEELNTTTNTWEAVKVAGTSVSLVGDSLGFYWELDIKGWNSAATNFAANKTAAEQGKGKAFAIRRQGGYLTRLEADFTIKTKYNNNKDSLTIKPERGVFECLRMN